MTATVVITPLNRDSEVGGKPDQRVTVIIKVNADVIAVEAALHIARTWLAENISDLLGVAKPELIIHDGLFWRFEVMLGLPNNIQPGSGALYSVGQMWLNAETGEIVDAEALAAELRVHVASIAP